MPKQLFALAVDLGCASAVVLGQTLKRATI
jgi:hypothetical protein